MVKPGWRSKALLQHAISLVPGIDHHINYALQTRLTKSYPVSDAKLADDIKLARHHVAVLRRNGGTPIEDARFYEFGAGWDLAMPLALRSQGVRRQLVIDIRRLLRPRLVVDVARRIGLPDVPDEASPDGVYRLLERNGIEYRAPCDARATGEDSRSVDYITSTNTLEHIAKPDLRAILAECHRILRDDGLLSFQVDYKDHYSYFDRRLSSYSFLRYSPARWRVYNPSLHFQNRLRHTDYLATYEAAGFDIVEADVVSGTAEDIATISELPPHRSYDGYSADDLAVRECRIVLRKSRSPEHVDG